MTPLPCTHAAKNYIVYYYDELCPQKRGTSDMNIHILSGRGFFLIPDSCSKLNYPGPYVRSYLIPS